MWPADPGRAAHNLVLTIRMTASEQASGDLPVTSTPPLQQRWPIRRRGVRLRRVRRYRARLHAGDPDTLRKGRSITGDFGFAVPKGKTTDIVVAFAPGLEYVDATFTDRA